MQTHQLSVHTFVRSCIVQSNFVSKRFQIRGRYRRNIYSAETSV